MMDLGYQLTWVSRFLLVSLIMDAILEDATIHQRKQTLHKMTKGFGLDDAYRTTLDRIREQKGSRVRLGMEALMWISCSERPLKAEELCQALAVEVGTTDLIVDNVPSARTLLSCTLGLVTIDEQVPVARLVHFTLQEYLAAHPSLFTTPHSMMAEICLTYLNFRSVCELSTSLDTIPSTTPFLHYSSCSWGFHARKNLTESVKRLALLFLQRDANHISADILLREESCGFLDWWDRRHGRHPDLRGFTGLHYIAYMGISEIASAMVDMKIWDLNGCDSKGATPLMWASKYGNFAITKLLLDQGVDPNLSNKGGLTSLTYAAQAGFQDVVKLLLEEGYVSPDSPDEDGRTPLSYAAGSGHEGVVNILLEQEEVNPNSPNKYGQTPLSYAAQSGREGVVKILLERGDVNPNSSGSDCWTPLLSAAQRGYEGVVKILLERGDVNPDSPDKDGRTPLSYAAESGHVDVVKTLLDRGDVNPDSPNKDSWTPLSYAAGSGHEGVVKILLARGDVNPDSSGKDGRTPLSYAAAFGHEGVMEILLEPGDVNPDSLDKDGRTPLSYAAQVGYEDIVKMLLEREDVNPNPCDNDGRSLLSYAAVSGVVAVVKILLERGDVNPDCSGKDGRTPLSYAAESGYVGVVKILLEQEDVNPDLSDEDGRTPLSYAAQSEHVGVVKILLERVDVNPDLSDKGGRTPLSYAAEGWRRNIASPFLCIASPATKTAGVVKMLLAREDVAPDSEDANGRTPLSHAAGNGRRGAAKLLLRRGDVNPASLDKHDRTPLWHAAQSWHTILARKLSKRMPFDHQASQTSSATPKISSPALSAEEGVEICPISPQERIILGKRDKSPEPIPYPTIDEYLLSLREEHPSASAPASISTSDTTPDPAITKPSRPPKRHAETQLPLRRSKRKRFPPS